MGDAARGAGLPDPRPVHNDVSHSEATSIIQAGVIHGGIHFHFPDDLADRPPAPPPPALFDAAAPLLSREQADEAYRAACELEFGWDERTEDDRERIELLHRAAAEAGNADAMARVGLIAEGRLPSLMRGTEPREPSAEDIETAKGWYTRSATRGSAFGALYLGRLHEERLGDPAEALRWYEKAAHGGHDAGRARYEGLRKRLLLGLGPLAGGREFGEKHAQPTGRVQATVGDAMTSRDAYGQWLNDAWRGNEASAMAACLWALAEAFGGSYGEWGTLDEGAQAAVLQHFSTLHPTQVTLPAVAFEYQEGVGDGNLRALATKLRTDPRSVAPAGRYAPVWLRKVRDNRVSTQEFTYAIELDIQDYDSLQWCIDQAIESMRSEKRPDERHLENLLDLNMLGRALAEGRDRAVPAASGGGERWGFMVLTTPECMALLKKLSVGYSRGSDGPEDFQEFWRRVDAALDAAPAHPFE